LGMSDVRYADSTNTLQHGSWRNTVILNSEPVFTAIFATEAVLKIIGMGFVVSQGSYLRDPWNILDFTVVLAAYVCGCCGLLSPGLVWPFMLRLWIFVRRRRVLSSIPAVPNISIVRSFRILRPLRSLTMLPGWSLCCPVVVPRACHQLSLVSLLPGMRILIMSLLHSLPALCNVVFLVLFMFTVFGILGVQLLCVIFPVRILATPGRHWCACASRTVPAEPVRSMHVAG
jgi:hypothetical protein